MSEFVNALNTISGQVGPVPASYLKHPFFKNQLVEVIPGKKNYDPNFYQPKTADEYRASRPEPVLVDIPETNYESEYEDIEDGDA